MTQLLSVVRNSTTVHKQYFTKALRFLQCFSANLSQPFHKMAENHNEQVLSNNFTTTLKVMENAYANQCHT